jgi:hypothetical protein
VRTPPSAGSVYLTSGRCPHWAPTGRRCVLPAGHRDHEHPVAPPGPPLIAHVLRDGTVKRDTTAMHGGRIPPLA